MIPADLRLIWAKSSPYMSLWTHSLCAGLCAERFLAAQSNRRLLSFLSQQLHTCDKETIQLISYLASVHDIGKAHPAFQRKDQELMHRLTGHFPEAFQQEPVEPLIPSFRHEHYSSAVLQRIWRQKGLSRELCLLYSTAVALHHQKPRDRMSLIPPRNPIWAELQDLLEREMALRFLCNSVLRLPDSVDSTCMLISSLIILMDWVASSAFFCQAEDLSEAEIQILVDRSLHLLGLIDSSSFSSVSSFSQMFPAISNLRPLQRACEGLHPDASLTIIEAPMGEGKTEAALFHAARAAQKLESRGLYFALPSQATSNQMFSRMNAWLEQIGTKDARLLHGTAFLTQQLPDQFTTEDETIAAKWLQPARMGFLGPNAVGTIDQAMATVLRSRFSMVRLVGLSNKVLIIDEVHAYDLYMSQIIETLLRWCHSCAIPVILLSATMQQTQRQRYLSCFTAAPLPDLSSSYPLLTQVLPDGTIQQQPCDASSHYHYQFVPVRTDYNAASIAQYALQSVHDGGCLAIMVNTVAHAQEIYRAVRSCECDEISLFLFHSRFPLCRRSEIEKTCVEAFGADRSRRPQKAILIATQVVEQSIDLDFDGMISELAPMDLLLQRAGRLHRHRQNKRPSAFCEPIVHVLLPADDATQTLDRRYGSSGFVYNPFILHNTEQLLSEKRSIRVPEDIRDVVDEAYSNVTSANTDAWLQYSMKGLLETAKAKGCTWPYPEAESFFPMESTIYYDINDPSDHPDSSEASTRLGDQSLRVSFCSEESFDRYTHSGILSADAIHIYENSVPLRLKESELEGNTNAMKISKGKLAGIWLLRGENKIILHALTIINDPALGVFLEDK